MLQDVLDGCLGEDGVVEVEEGKDSPLPLAAAHQLAGKAGDKLGHDGGVHVGVLQTAQHGPHQPTGQGRGRREGEEGGWIGKVEEGRMGGGREGEDVM